MAVSPHPPSGCVSESVCLSCQNVRLPCGDFVSLNFIMTDNTDSSLFINTETWINPDESAPTAFIFPPAKTNRSRRDDLRCSPVSLGRFSSFDSLKNKYPISHVLICIYIISGFLQDFSELLSVRMSQYDRVLILDEFDILLTHL